VIATNGTVTKTQSFGCISSQSNALIMKQTALVLFSLTVLLVACNPGATEGDISLLHVRNFDRNHLLKLGYVAAELEPDTAELHSHLLNRFLGLFSQESDIAHLFSYSKGDTLSMIFFDAYKPTSNMLEISYDNEFEAKKAFNNWANGKIPGFTPIGLIASDSNTLIVRDEVLRLYKEVRLLSNHKIFVYHPIPRYE
jgi:hypothetical protein